MAEWSIAAVLKTVELRGSGGSNPSLSADIAAQEAVFLVLEGFSLHQLIFDYINLHQIFIPK